MKLSVFWNAAAGTWIESRRSHYSAFGGLQKGGRVTGVASRVKSLTVWSVLTETKRDCRNTSVETADLNTDWRNWMLNMIRPATEVNLASVQMVQVCFHPPYNLLLEVWRFMHCKNISNQRIFVCYWVLKWWSCRGRKESASWWKSDINFLFPASTDLDVNVDFELKTVW